MRARAFEEKPSLPRLEAAKTRGAASYSRVLDLNLVKHQAPLKHPQSLRSLTPSACDPRAFARTPHTPHPSPCTTENNARPAHLVLQQEVADQPDSIRRRVLSRGESAAVSLAHAKRFWLWPSTPPHFSSTT